MLELLEVDLKMKEQLKYALIICGVLLLITVGMKLMQGLYAENLAMKTEVRNCTLHNYSHIKNILLYFDRSF